MIEWRTQLEDIRRLEADWRALEETTRNRSVQGRWDYVYPWYRHLTHGQRTPLLGIAWCGPTLVGVAPLVAWKGTLGGVPVRRVDFAGHQWDGGELLLRDGRPDVAGDLVRSLARRGAFDVACFNNLMPGTETWAAVEQEARRSGMWFIRSDYSVALVDLCDGFEAYCAAMSQNFRRNMKRMARRIEAAGGFAVDRLSAGAAGSDVQPFLARIFSIGDRSWKTREVGTLAPEHRRFTEDVICRFAERGMADVGILTIGGRDAAFVVALVEHGTYYDFTVSFDDEFSSLSPGIFLMIEILRRISEQGIQRVVSHGAHEYKRRWASEFVNYSRAYLFRPTVMSFLSRTSKFTLPAWRRRLRTAPPVGPGPAPSARLRDGGGEP